MNFQIKNTYFRIIIIILSFQLSIGCSVIGLTVGTNIDDSNILIQIDKIEEVESNTEIVILLRNDNTIYGAYEKVSNDSIQLMDGNVIAFKDINEIQLLEEPSSGKVVWTTIGATVDVLVFGFLLLLALFSVPR
jgi:hypothetical protein